MKERPILFSAPMVRAILNGNKSQTRRICKSQPYANGHKWDGHDFLFHNDYLPPSAMLMDGGSKKWSYTTSDVEGWEQECPYGQPGDRLWVKESILRGYCGDMEMSRFAADEMPTLADAWPWQRDRLNSIHCPRGLSRIDLEITGVRVERLKMIGERDARDEGVTIEDRHLNGYCAGECYPPSVRAYRELWETINGAGSWDLNPFCWVIEFRHLKDKQ